MNAIRKLSAKSGHFELSPYSAESDQGYGMNAEHAPYEMSPLVDIRCYFSSPFGRRVLVPDFDEVVTYRDYCLKAHEACQAEADDYHADPAGYIADLTVEAGSDLDTLAARDAVQALHEYLPAIAQDWAAIQDERAADKARIAELEQAAE